MDKQELENKRKEFVKLFLSAKFTQKEIADKIGISYVTATNGRKVSLPRNMPV